MKKTSSHILTRKIMNSVVDWEMHRIKRWIFSFVVFFALSLAGFFILAFFIHTTLVEQQTLALFSILEEDVEIIKDYGLEVIDTFWEELPKLPLLITSIFLGIVGATVFIFSANFSELEKKRKSLYAYSQKKGNSMDKKKTSLAPYAIVGVVIILAILVLYPRLNRFMTKKSQEEPTITSETASPESSPVEKIQAKTITLVVASPKDKSEVKTASIQVKGTTSPFADVFVNEIDTKADAKGNFSVSYQLEEGENYLIVGANDEEGNFADQELTVTYYP